MRYLNEEQTSRIVDEALALEAAREAFLAQGRVFPVVVGGTDVAGERFTLKSGSAGTATGVKIGTYWPGNDAHGIPRHGSTTILLDPDTGRLRAVLEVAAANAKRTAAADALAAQTLAREDARTLAVIGTGHQAFAEALAVVRVRPIERVLIAGRDPGKAEQLAARLRERLELTVEAAPVRDAVEQADVVVTVTTAREPLFDAEWVRPGTHISAMGADGSGKRELPGGLYDTGVLFCDIPDQSRSIGEFSHAPDTVAVTALGDVLRGDAPGRTDEEQITVFDSSGFALQDLALAERILAVDSESSPPPERSSPEQPSAGVA